MMPFVSGGSLRERVERDAPLDPDEALRLTRQVASALDYAHRADVMHRDIKPENILFSEGLAVVADFGVAKAVSTVDRQTLTRALALRAADRFESPGGFVEALAAAEVRGAADSGSEAARPTAREPALAHLWRRNPTFPRAPDVSFAKERLTAERTVEGEIAEAAYPEAVDAI